MTAEQMQAIADAARRAADAAPPLSAAQVERLTALFRGGAAE